MFTSIQPFNKTIILKQYLLLLGGFLGFCCVFVTGIVAGNDIVQTLFNASIGCIVGGMMLKWLGIIIIDCYVSQKRMEAQAAIDAASTNEEPPASKGGR